MSDIPAESGIRSGRFFLENRFLRIDVHPNGTLFVLDKERNVRYRGLNLFEDGGDVGDSRGYRPPVHDRKIVSKSFPVRLSLIENDPAIRIRVRMKIPVSVTQDRRMRSARKGLIKLWSMIRLEADSRILFFETRVANQADDHRLRVLFPTDCDPKTCRVETFLPAAERSPIPSDVSEVPPVIPLVAVQDQSRALGLLTEGLDASELKPDHRRTLCLTLLRSVGNISPEEELSNPAGQPFKIPDTTCRGQYHFRYALDFHPAYL